MVALIRTNIGASPAEAFADVFDGRKITGVEPLDDTKLLVWLDDGSQLKVYVSGLYRLSR